MEAPLWCAECGSGAEPRPWASSCLCLPWLRPTPLSSTPDFLRRREALTQGALVAAGLACHMPVRAGPGQTRGAFLGPTLGTGGGGVLLGSGSGERSVSTGSLPGPFGGALSWGSPSVWAWAAGHAHCTHLSWRWGWPGPRASMSVDGVHRWRRGLPACSP